jgi:hypothetical protein
MLATLKELQLATLNVLHFFILCTQKIRDLCICEMGKRVGMSVDGVSVTETATSFGVLRVIVICKVKSAHKNHWKRASVNKRKGRK